MASASQSSQHRCVFVGNIPYDATEEQLKQICEEVGPVVHFRLVIDRETGKPKGYGFCEYKDEETALSARRNLQGYDINGRQLRVDFAENDKNTDRNRDQGREPTGMVSNTDSQRQSAGQAVMDASLYQPMGVSTAIAAATSMAKALGAAQTTNIPNQMGMQSQPLGSDPLTLHLAKMSRNQLNEIMLELKAMATQNKEQARQVLLGHPNLTKAIFQAQFMLGMVTPQMLQMPNILQPAGQPQHPLLPDTCSQQQPGQVVPGLPPLPPHRQFNLAKGYDTGGPSLTIPSSSSVQSQNGTLLQFSAYNQAQTPLHAQSQVLQHGHLPMQSGISTNPSLQHQLPSTSISRLSPLEGPSSSLNQQMQVPLPQNMGPSIISGLKPQITDPSLADQSLQASGAEKGKQLNDKSRLVARPSKLMRLNDGRATAADVKMNMIAVASGKPASNGIVGNLIPKTEAAYDSEKTGASVQLPPDVESALLQQVMSLTPEQISSLPPDQQQQVIQLQQVLRQST